LLLHQTVPWVGDFFRTGSMIAANRYRKGNYFPYPKPWPKKHAKKNKKCLLTMFLKSIHSLGGEQLHFSFKAHTLKQLEKQHCVLNGVLLPTPFL